MSQGTGSLRALAERLSSFGLPSLSSLLVAVTQVDEYKAFILLIREYLPEREKDIRHETTPQAQMAKFADYFEDRYFPLHPFVRDMECEDYADLVNRIPVIVRGMSDDDYEAIASDFDAGYQLLTYLVENPWGTSDSRGQFHPNGRLVSLTEACSKLVSSELLMRVPEKGLSRDEMHRYFDNTPYRAAAVWADMLHQSTNNAFLDTDNESYSDGPEWTREEVEGCTEAWHQADVLDNQVSELVKWLQEDLRQHFAILVEIITRKGGARNYDATGDAEGVQLGLPLGASGDTCDSPGRAAMPA